MQAATPDQKTVVITGANGGIGSLLAKALRPIYKLVLVDNKSGRDTNNRRGIEGIDEASGPSDILIMDLSKEKEKFSRLLAETHPDCVIHAAGILENQPPDKIQLNDAINKTVLEGCAFHSVKLIAMSSVMVMYGEAMYRYKIRSAMACKTTTQFTRTTGFIETERLSVDAPLLNNEMSLGLFNPDSAESNLAYIQSKERLESLAFDFCKGRDLSMIMVRLGWVRLSDEHPFKLEGEDNPFSEITACLSTPDFNRFISKLLEAVVNKRLRGYHCYAPVSECTYQGKSFRWLSVQNAENDFDWKPVDNILEQHPPKPSESMPLYSAHKKTAVAPVEYTAAALH